MSSSGSESESENEVQLLDRNTRESGEGGSGQQPNPFKCPSKIRELYADGPLNKKKPFLQYVRHVNQRQKESGGVELSCLPYRF